MDRYTGTEEWIWKAVKMKEDSGRKKSLKASIREEKRSKKSKRAGRKKKRVDRARERVRLTSRQDWKFSLMAAGAVALVAGGTWAYLALTPHLPPTEMAGHTEILPPGHIFSTHMSENVQRHMLEHADGKGPPGVIVQYNCEDYVCEPGLAKKLENLVRRYSTYVYLAPGNYDGVIILTKRGALEILEGFDKRSIESFIRR